jgi:MtfA peptidase
MPAWIDALLRRKPGAIADGLWQHTLTRYPFLSDRRSESQVRLRRLSFEFLQQKEFHGAQGLVISDEMAVAIAAQACLPILNLADGDALNWYDDFVGIVVHPGEVVARRETQDESGVVHHYQEVLSGEAMEGGPVTLSWKDVAESGDSAAQGYNVVIHEFAHKIDMRDGLADGCPPLPRDFLGASSARSARALWLATLQGQFDQFRDQISLAERFGAQTPWLDPYGASSPSEFFAVACEAYFVNPKRLADDFAPLVALFDAFFNPGSAT